MFFTRRKTPVVKSLAEFIEKVSEARTDWQKDPTEELWFRGEDGKHSNSSLQPRLYRSRKQLSDLLKIEKRLFDEFERCGVQLSGGIIEDEWDWYFLMQHHGGPTRLLDWSDGALLALHFAIRDKNPPVEADSLVYIVDPYWLNSLLDELPTVKARTATWKNRADAGEFPKGDWEDEMDKIYMPGSEEDFQKDPLPTEPLVLEFPHISRRVAAQRSRFMVFGTDPEWLRRLVGKSDSRIREIRISAESIPTIQQDLRASGVTESVIFPDLDGLGREISQLWQQCLRV